MTKIKTLFYSILILFFSIFIISSLFLRAEYNSVLYGDNPILSSQNIFLLFGLSIIILLLNVLLYKICSKLNSCSSKVIIPIILTITGILHLLVIFLLPRLPSDDSQTVLGIALNILKNNNYSAFDKTGYLHMFPFNFSYVMFLVAILKIFPLNYITIKVFNILFSLITSLLIFLIYKELTQKKDFVILIFATTYIPSILLTNFIYNDVISTTFFTLSIYFAIKFINCKQYKYIIFLAITLSIGNFLRQVGIIILIATIIYFILNFSSIGFKKILISLSIIIIIFNIPSYTTDFTLQKTGLVTSSIYENAAPFNMWINMGMNKDSFGFWDEFKSYNIYQQNANYNKEVAQNLFTDNILNTLSNYSIKDIVNIYYNKLIWIWTEGTYQIERYGIGIQNSRNMRNMVPSGGYSYSTFLTDFFNNGTTPKTILLWFLYIVNFLMYIFIFIKLVLSIKNKKFNEIYLILIILGFIAFYSLWEIKSRYLYPVYPIILSIAYMGFKDTLQICSNKIKKHNNF